MAVEVATAYVTLLPSFRGGIGAINKEAAVMGQAFSGTMAGEVTGSTKKTGSLGRAFAGIGGSLAGGLLVGAGAAGITSLLSGFVGEAEEAQKIGKQTNAVLQSTGSVANVSAGDVGKLADALSLKSGIDDEIIASGENVLLTFTNIRNEAGKGNDIFNQGSEAALNMSVALGTDLQGSVTQVGKALNDPIKGTTSLSRAGVQFTDQQKEQIKTLVESGDTLGAQKIILGELETQFGGSAEAGATASDKLGVAWGNVQEQLGTYLLPIFESVSTWLAEKLPGAVEWMKGAIEEVRAFFEEHRAQFEAVGNVLGYIWGWIKTQIKIFVAVLRAEWEALKWIVEFVYNNIYEPLKTAFMAVFNFLKPIVEQGVRDIKALWGVIVDVYTFFKTRVYDPLIMVVGVMFSGIQTAVEVGVGAIKTAWNAIVDVYNFFKTRIYDPLMMVVGILRDGIIKAFEMAVDGVKWAWDKLKDIVKEPINLVIGFYNNGIRAVWNNVISKIPGVGNLASVEKLAKGGFVPGRGNRDTVPAMLTPGEFVVTKEAAKRLGPGLALLNKGGTLDPGIFGYAAGGFVRSAEEVAAWTRSHAGKRYRFPDVGPDTFDCSGLTSAVLNYALGLSPFRRRHSSGTALMDPALTSGLGDPLGLSFGARPPYTTNAQGARVGHIAGTVNGMNFEATPPAVRVGAGARGSSDGMFTQFMHLAGFGGLTDEDKGIVGWLRALKDLVTPNFGGPPIGDLLNSLFKDFPGKVYNFLTSSLPEMIVGAVTDAAVSVFKAITPFADGGAVRRNGPILVGERGPEIMYGNRGEFVAPLNGSNAGIGGPLIGTLVNNRRDLTPVDLAQMVRIAQLVTV